MFSTAHEGPGAQIFNFILSGKREYTLFECPYFTNFALLCYDILNDVIVVPEECERGVNGFGKTTACGTVNTERC